MSYQLNCSEFNSQKIIQRIQQTDLIPSLDCIKTEAETILEKLENKGFDNLEKIRKALKNKKKLEEIAHEESIDEKLLILFKREIEGWIVKIRSIDEFEWIAPHYLKKVKEYGIKNSEDAYQKLGDDQSRKKLSQEKKIDNVIVEEIYEISNLMRIRWLSPNFTRIIYELQYTIEKIQKAEHKKLCEEIDDYNKKMKYYKGKIGERDVKRIIFESQFVK